MKINATVKPIVEAHPIIIDDLFNCGYRAGKLEDTEEEERKVFESLLNKELTMIFKAGQEYERALITSEICNLRGVE